MNQGLLTVAAVAVALVASVVGAAYVTDVGGSLLGDDSQSPAPTSTSPTAEPTATPTQTRTPAAESTPTPTADGSGDAAAASGDGAGGAGTSVGSGTSRSELDVGGDATPTPEPTSTPTVEPTPEPTPRADGGSSGGDATPTRPDYDFAFRTTGTENCGSTCRDVTVKLTNRGTETARDVTVRSRILADGDQIWSGTESIGRVQSGESVTRTKRVNLGFLDAAKVQQNDGYVTIETTVNWNGGTQTFTERTKVT